MKQSIESYIVGIHSARYFKFIMKPWNFVRIFLSLFLIKILGETSLKSNKMLMSARFWAYFFFCKPLQSIYHWKENAYLESLNIKFSKDIIAERQKVWGLISRFINEIKLVNFVQLSTIYYIFKSEKVVSFIETFFSNCSSYIKLSDRGNEHSHYATFLSDLSNQLTSTLFNINEKKVWT